MPKPTLTWIRVGEHYPDLAGELDSFLALDGETEVGIVKFLPTGVDAGSWMWSMLLTHPGPAFRRPTNGMTPTRGERQLVACWHTFRSWFGLDE